MTDAAGARIVPVEPRDVERLAKLARTIWLAHYRGIISDAQIEYMLDQRYQEPLIRAELARPDIEWVQLIVGQSTAGFASWHRKTEAMEMKLDKLYMHPAHQRRGYGGLLIERALRAAHDAGVKRLSLMVNRHNANAIAAYRKHGFRLDGAAVTDIGGGYFMDDYRMVRDTESDLRRATAAPES